MSSKSRTNTNVVQINPALKGYTLAQRHPLSDHKASDPEVLAAVTQVELEKVDAILRAVVLMTTDHPDIQNLVGVGISIVDDLRNTLDCEEECHRDAKLAARA
jgi:hypothetical protein